MNIIVDLEGGTIQDGTEVVFRSPVDCSQVTGLKVYHDNGIVDEFIFADAHGNNVGDIDHLFAENVAVKVILDTSTGMAFVQNADTNAYLEGRFAELEAMIGTGGGESSGIVNTASGSSIVLRDSAEAPLKGLTIAEPATVKVMGKNIADLRKFTTKDKIETPTSTCYATDSGFGTTLSATTGKSITVTQTKYPTTSAVTSYSNGFFTAGFYCPLNVGDRVTLSFNYKATSNPLGSLDMATVLNKVPISQVTLSVKDEETGLYSVTYYINSELAKENNWNFVEIRIGGKSGVFSNFQVEYGNTATDFEPYKEQTLVVSDISAIDYAQLHTYKPNTNITNDVGAEMSVEYVADTKAYIDNKFTELQNAILASGANV